MHPKLFTVSGENLNRESYDYVDSDPVVPIRIKSSDASGTYLAFLDTGSDGIAIPRELWDKLGLSYDYPIRIQSVTGLSRNMLFVLMGSGKKLLSMIKILGKHN